MPPRDLDVVLARLNTLETELARLTAEIERLHGILDEAGLSYVAP